MAHCSGCEGTAIKRTLESEDTMTPTTRIVFKNALNKKANPAGKLAGAELHFTVGPLQRLKIIGFAIRERRAPTAWVGRQGELWFLAGLASKI